MLIFRWRLEHCPLVPGETHRRIVAAGLGHLSLIDPANNQLMLPEPDNGELPVEFPV